MKLAIQLYSVRDKMEADFFGTLEQLADLGYEGVEFAGLFGNDPEAVAAACDRLGILPLSAHIGLGENWADELEAYAQVGCSYAVLPWLPEDVRPNAPDWEAGKKRISAYINKADELGMKVLYHNHAFEFEPFEEGTLLDAIFAADDRMESENDTCWTAVAGEDPCTYLQKFAGRAPLVHIKDYTLSEEGNVTFRPVGYGLQKLPELVTAAKNVGAMWLVVEQDAPDEGRGSVTCAALSAEALKPLLG